MLASVFYSDFWPSNFFQITCSDLVSDTDLIQIRIQSGCMLITIFQLSDDKGYRGADTIPSRGIVALKKGTGPATLEMTRKQSSSPHPPPVSVFAFWRAKCNCTQDLQYNSFLYKL